MPLGVVDGLPVAADEVLLDADGVPAAGGDLEDDLRVAHRVAVLFAVVGDADQVAAARAGADGLDSRPPPSASRRDVNSWTVAVNRG
jgi:hypothetical protein